MGYIPVISNLSYGLPLLILVVATLLWWWSTRAASPPYLVANPPFHSWRVNPVAAAYSSLHQDRYLLAAFLLRERVANLVQEKFGVSPEDLRSWASGGDVPPLPAPLTLRAVLRDLAAAYRSAYLAEGGRPWEAFSSVTLPLRRRRAERDFEKAAREVDQVMSAWRGTT
jgi:hypothetical protein